MPFIPKGKSKVSMLKQTANIKTHSSNSNLTQSPNPLIPQSTP